MDQGLFRSGRPEDEVGASKPPGSKSREKLDALHGWSGVVTRSSTTSVRVGGPAKDQQRTAFEGTVFRSEAGFCQVLLEDGRMVSVNLRKRIKGGRRETTTIAVIGDRVRLSLDQDGKSGVIEEVCERENELSRQAPGRPGLRDVLAANLDVVLIVQSMRQPDFNAGRLDRLLAIAEQAEIPPVVVINKIDLADSEELESLVQQYTDIGYPVIACSAKLQIGIEQIRRHLEGYVALVGPSGAGKSSILNAIKPGLTLKTGEVSEATNKGKHTTVASELLPIAPGSYVADTPGLRALALADMPPEDVDWLFLEFRPFARECRFGNCLHRDEIGCAVLAALEAGSISRSRYATYRHLLDEALEEKEREYA